MQKQETVLWTEFVWRLHANQETALAGRKIESLSAHEAGTGVFSALERKHDNNFFVRC
jgi:hypothetical protein